MNPASLSAAISLTVTSKWHWAVSALSLEQHSQGQATGELEGGSSRDFFGENLSEAVRQSTNVAERLQCAMERNRLEGGFQMGW